MPSNDVYQAHGRSPGSPARRAEAVTPSDTVDLTTYAKALYLGVGGDLTLIPAGSTAAVTLKNHAGGYVPVQARRVLATGTTAQHIVALSE
ncbi:hypothetical protein JIP62_05540 [Brevundimonas vitis]|uniref:Flagella basal body P-ring formation protein FlgA C-terminal domain-containing protein n=1 Tax=Brevundimonas vitisensis TaxID=2800818 RepID=A0ABX7BQ25_9CAUL|nr:hypothetical protein [Brevundimonas vitisensis]QQQ19555.1 hypothetical protein JIP62_05540 [Brevundimonas vitisensis]